MAQKSWYGQNVTFVHSNESFVAVMARWGTSLDLAIVSGVQRLELKSLTVNNDLSREHFTFCNHCNLDAQDTRHLVDNTTDISSDHQPLASYFLRSPASRLLFPPITSL